jgi:hypothetical protein
MSMSELGTLAIYDESGTNVYNLNFMNLLFPDGWPWDVMQRIAAPVTGQGVDGTRMRLIRRDFPRFRVIGESDFGTYDEAVSAGNSVISYARYRALFSWIADGVTYSPTDYAYIWGIAAKPVRCELVSAVAPSGQQALLHTEWLMQFTNAS